MTGRGATWKAGYPTGYSVTGMSGRLLSLPQSIHNERWIVNCKMLGCLLSLGPQIHGPTPS